MDVGSSPKPKVTVGVSVVIVAKLKFAPFSCQLSALNCQTVRICVHCSEQKNFANKFSLHYFF